MASPKNAARRRRGDAAKRERLAAKRTGRVVPQLEIAGAEDPRPEWAAHDACFTPEPVVAQGLQFLLAEGVVAKGCRVLDPCAGAGVFGKVVRRILEPTVLVGIEPRASEFPAVRRHYDVVAHAVAQSWCDASIDRQRFDLVITNPPWWCWTEIFWAAAGMLARGGVIAFLGPSSWGHSDESSEGADAFDRWTPAMQLRIRGRIAFNGGSATDNRKCSWWVWGKGENPTDWMTRTLPALPVCDRRWSIRPGTDPEFLTEHQADAAAIAERIVGGDP